FATRALVAEAPQRRPGVARGCDTARRPRASSSGERLRDDRLRLRDDGVQVVLAAEALRVDLVDVLGAGRARREPAVLGDDLETADRAARGRLRQAREDGLAGEAARRDGVRRELLQPRL